MNSVTSPRVFGYARVSTYEQKLSGLGLDSQRVAIDAEAARHGWTIEHHADEGVSGSLRPEDRPELGRILNEITAGDVLVVAKLDRLGRSALDVLRLAETARANGWRLVLLDLGLDTATPVGAFTLTALAAVAQLERDLIAQRTKDALNAARRNGTRLGRPVDTEENVRRRIAREFAAGTSLSEIARVLTGEGVPTARGGERWYASSVKAVLRSLEIDQEAAAASQAA
jgi:DNA invertase Pin-like site-specific DNA recombinase